MCFLFIFVFGGLPEKDSTWFPDFGVLLDFGALKIEAQEVTSKIRSEF